MLTQPPTPHSPAEPASDASQIEAKNAANTAKPRSKLWRWLRPSRPRLTNFKELKKFAGQGKIDPKDYLSERWLRQLRWWEYRAKTARRWYYFWRVVNLLAAAITPAAAILTANPVAPWPQRLGWLRRGASAPGGANAVIARGASAAGGRREAAGGQ